MSCRETESGHCPGVTQPGGEAGWLTGIYPRLPWEDSYPKDLEVILAQVAGLTALSGPPFHPGSRSTWGPWHASAPLVTSWCTPGRLLPPSALLPLQPLSPLHSDPCYSLLGLARLPEGSLKLEPPTQAALLGAPTKGPGYPGRSTQQHTRPPYLLLDLLLPRNLTGQCSGGGGRRTGR